MSDCRETMPRPSRSARPRLETLSRRDTPSTLALAPSLSTSTALTNPGVVRGFNPQPDPPGSGEIGSSSTSIVVNW